MTWIEAAGLITALGTLIGVLAQGAKTRAENAKLRAETAAILATLSPNSGTSLLDKIDAINFRTKELAASVGSIRDDARADREALALHQRATADATSAINDRLTTIERKIIK